MALLPHDFPPWEAVYQQSRRWLAAGAFDHLMGDLRELLREAHDKKSSPTACILEALLHKSGSASVERVGLVA